MTDLHLDDRRALLLIKIIYNVRPADDGTRISQITYFLEKISHLTYIMMLKENRKEFKYLQFDRLLKLLTGGELIGRSEYLLEKKFITKDELNFVEELTREWENISIFPRKKF